MSEQPNNPLHGKTLESILTDLVELFGWEELGYLIPVNCFLKDPSIKSSLPNIYRSIKKEVLGEI